MSTKNTLTELKDKIAVEKGYTSFQAFMDEDKLPLDKKLKLITEIVEEAHARFFDSYKSVVQPIKTIDELSEKLYNYSGLLTQSGGLTKLESEKIIKWLDLQIEFTKKQPSTSSVNLLIETSVNEKAKTTGKTIEQCKDEVAKKYGFENHQKLIEHNNVAYEMKFYKDLFEIYASKSHTNLQDKIKEIEGILMVHKTMRDNPAPSGATENFKHSCIVKIHLIESILEILKK